MVMLSISQKNITKKGIKMQKTTFKISKMDCPSEEQMIRLKLNNFSGIQSLHFDTANRLLVVFHENNPTIIYHAIDDLKLGITTIIDTVEANENNSINNNQNERQLLLYVLAINFIFFILELLTGFLSKSMGLIADSLDMLADSIVYGLALFAVGGTANKKKSIAMISGYFQLTLAVLGFLEIVRSFLSINNPPNFQIMIGISILALLGNTICFFLLQKNKSKEAHMKASMIFTSNDIIVNLGVIFAGLMVYATSSKYPDLIVGGIVFALVSKGAFRILQLSK